jgi:hypothetical protein
VYVRHVDSLYGISGNLKSFQGPVLTCRQGPVLKCRGSRERRALYLNE